MRPSSLQAGFSLIEVLVAMVVGSMLIALSTSAVSTIRARWQSATDFHARIENQSRTVSVLYKLIERAVPFSLNPGGAAFEGTVDEIRFSAPAPLAFETSGLMRYSLRTMRLEGERYSLILDVLDTEGSSAPIISEVLFSDLNIVKFTYYENASSGVVSQTSWIGKKGLPGMIEVALKSAGEDQPVTRIKMRPRMTVDSRCLFDPVSRKCRL